MTMLMMMMTIMPIASRQFRRKAGAIVDRRREPGGVRHTVHRRTWRRASHRASPSLASRVTPYVDRVLRPVSHRASLEFVGRSSVVCEHKLAEKWLGHKSPQKFRDSH
jgi:hypothetical protein